MKRLILTFALLLANNSLLPATTMPVSNMPIPAQQTATWHLISTNGQIPQQDYTTILFHNHVEVLTGGPLAYGPALCGIWDITGPDWADIAAYLDSRAGLQSQPTLIAQYTNAHRPPAPLGADPGLWALPLNQVNLRPQALWLIPSASHKTMQTATVPEPTSATLFLLGAYWLYRRRDKTPVHTEA